MAQKTKTKLWPLVLLLAGVGVFVAATGGLPDLSIFTRQDNWVDLDLQWNPKVVTVYITTTVDGHREGPSGQMGGKFHKRVYDWWGQAHIDAYVNPGVNAVADFVCTVKPWQGPGDTRYAERSREISCGVGG